MNNKILIITGMHRSGTSLVVNIFQNCGVKLGENLIFLISLPRSGSTLLQHILEGHCGFKDEELDFIILYNIKYKIRKELEAEEE